MVGVYTLDTSVPPLHRVSISSSMVWTMHSKHDFIGQTGPPSPNERIPPLHSVSTAWTMHSKHDFIEQTGTPSPNERNQLVHKMLLAQGYITSYFDDSKTHDDYGTNCP